VSSKGFPTDEDGISEAARALDFVAQDLTEAILISAYDIHYRRLLDVDRLQGPEHLETLYGWPKLLIIDSGGYELSPQYESGFPRRDTWTPEPFSQENFAGVIERLPPGRETLLVNFDQEEESRGTFAEQRVRAQEFFAARPHFLSDFLIKPEPGTQFIDVRNLTPEAPNLNAFKVIGVTEKELGATVLERLAALGRLRKLLDESAVPAPIHVFGALDPLFTPLYYMMGGEIFDGLSWIRYAYQQGLALHPESFGILMRIVDDGQQRRDFKRYMSNVGELKEMKHRLTRWCDDETRFDHLGEQAETLREIYETALTQVAGKD
jgi:hypothetical protein